MSRTLRRAVWMVIGVFLAVFMGSACGSNSYYTKPSAFTMPNGQQCAPWVSNPFENTGWMGVPQCPYPIPQQQPVMMPGMSAFDYRMMQDYYLYGAGHSNFYFAPDYYPTYISTAWGAHPGTYYGYGRTPVVHYTTINDYRTTVGSYDRTNASTIRTAVANPKYSTYTGSDGKSYTGKTVPAKSFSGGNSPAIRAGGNAGTSSNYGTSTSGTGNKGSPNSSYTGSTGKGGYSGSSGYSGGSKGGYSGGSSSSPKSGR